MFLSLGIFSKAISRRVFKKSGGDEACLHIMSGVGQERQVGSGSWVRFVIVAADGRLGAAVKTDVGDTPSTSLSRRAG